MSADNTSAYVWQYVIIILDRSDQSVTYKTTPCHKFLDSGPETCNRASLCTIVKSFSISPLTLTKTVLMMRNKSYISIKLYCFMDDVSHVLGFQPLNYKIPP